MRIAYVGTHDPMTNRGTPWTTETAWAASLELLGPGTGPIMMMLGELPGDPTNERALSTARIAQKDDSPTFRDDVEHCFSPCGRHTITQGNRTGNRLRERFATGAL